MATQKTINITGQTVNIPAMGDQPDMSVVTNCIDKSIDGINALGYGKLLTNSDDLNTIAEGTYYFNATSVPSHSPATNNSLVESWGSGQKFQKVTTASSGIVLEYARRYYNGSWSDWQLLPSQIAVKVTDLNNCTDPLVNYYCDNTAQHSPTGSYLFVRVLNANVSGNLYYTQIASPMNSTTPYLWVRTKTTDTWGDWKRLSFKSDVDRTQLTMTRTENSYVSATEFARCSAHRCGKTLMFIFNCTLSGASMSDFVEIGTISGWSAANDTFQSVMPQNGESKPVMLQVQSTGKIRIYGGAGTAYSFYRASVCAPEY